MGREVLGKGMPKKRPDPWQTGAYYAEIYFEYGINSGIDIIPW